MRRRTAGTVQLSLFLAALVFVLAGCGLGTATTPPASSIAPSQPASASQSPVQSNQPSASAGVPSEEPSTGPTPTDSETPSTGPQPSDTAIPSPSPSNSASVCSGAKDTPDFYASFAGSVSFPVYCAVLPAGWSLVSGTYRLANGGHITINFRRKSDNATFELDEGSFCADSSGCVPAGTAVGSGPFGDLTGDLVQTSTGFAVVVAKGEKPSWLAIGNGLDQATFTALTAALHALS
jgi:predicted small lipoprotein YifL